MDYFGKYIILLSIVLIMLLRIILLKSISSKSKDHFYKNYILGSFVYKKKKTLYNTFLIWNRLYFKCLSGLLKIL